ncbi:hypothetical protein ACPA9J_32020 [Pseudomonas aeruginosa]
MKHQVGKLLRSSPISAAGYRRLHPRRSGQGRGFLILPHEQARMAWRIKQQNPRRSMTR